MTNIDTSNIRRNAFGQSTAVFERDGRGRPVRLLKADDRPTVEWVEEVAAPGFAVGDHVAFPEQPGGATGGVLVGTELAAPHRLVVKLIVGQHFGHLLTLEELTLTYRPAPQKSQREQVAEAGERLRQMDEYDNTWG